VSAYPLMLEGTALRALVVGGGSVATRKARALLDAGATVRLVAPRIDEALRSLDSVRLALAMREYAPDDIADALLVIAATSSRAVNAQVAEDARARGRLVNVTDAPADGNCVTPATHRAGNLVVAVAAAGVPPAARRIRDSIAARYGESYAHAVAELATIRTGLLADDQRARWADVVDEVVGPDFCETVERGMFADRVAPWR